MTATRRDIRGSEMIDEAQDAAESPPTAAPAIVMPAFCGLFFKR